MYITYLRALVLVVSNCYIATLGLSKTTENPTHLKDPSRNRTDPAKWWSVAN